MILIFGGTTEGRKAAAVCEEGEKPFYYSTKGNLQPIELHHGMHITGALNEEAMLSFCKEHAIRLIVDAAHPFAEMLHQTIAHTSERLNIPVLRLERQYPARDKRLLWFDGYAEAIEYLNRKNINNLLALSGVNTIAKLKPYWLTHRCFFRILDREESREIAQHEGFPSEHLIYYRGSENEAALFAELNPQAIITKESGDSGGFNEKVEAALALNIPLLVVKRPALSPSFIPVYGENGLRKQIETLVPEFFRLRTGYTTGVCATAATKAALIALLTKEAQLLVSLTLPNGEQVELPVAATRMDNDTASCTVIKDAGDDPDVTHGQEIVSTVRLNVAHQEVRFLQGNGVGKVTLPGLGLPIGEPAINATPRQMMTREVEEVMARYQNVLPDQASAMGVDVTISVPHGEEIARKTFNPKLGIVGGISIIGTSGIVKPFSSEAFIASIRREIEVAKALGCTHIVINSGAKSEKYVKQLYPDLPPQAFIHYGNFIGKTLESASELSIQKVTLGVMLGKAVKLADGHLDTHSKKVVMNKGFLMDMARQSGCSEKSVEGIGNIMMARQLWEVIPQEECAFFSLLLKRCEAVCAPLLPNGLLEMVLIHEDGTMIRG